MSKCILNIKSVGEINKEKIQIFYYIKNFKSVSKQNDKL